MEPPPTVNGSSLENKLRIEKEYLIAGQRCSKGNTGEQNGWHRRFETRMNARKKMWQVAFQAQSGEGDGTVNNGTDKGRAD